MSYVSDVVVDKGSKTGGFTVRTLKEIKETNKSEIKKQKINVDIKKSRRGCTRCLRDSAEKVEGGERGKVPVGIVKKFPSQRNCVTSHRSQ